jgi:hypothetical protein
MTRWKSIVQYSHSGWCNRLISVFKQNLCNKSLQLVGKHSSDAFLIQTDLKHGDVLLALLFKFPLEYAVNSVQETQYD